MTLPSRLSRVRPRRALRHRVLRRRDAPCSALLRRVRSYGGRPGMPDARQGERGDVPGWVLVTLMTAGLVLVIWALAGPALSGVFQQAIDRVTSF